MQVQKYEAPDGCNVGGKQVIAVASRAVEARIAELLPA